MENIEEIFKDKKFNQETLNFITNFIDEFDVLFGKYISREDLIIRIKENLNENIEFTTFDRENVVGNYCGISKKVSLDKNLSEDMMKSVFFHEMIHCITNRGDYIGFSDELDLDSRTAIGLTEGFTQYVSKIRNEMYGSTINSYPILTEQTENLAQVLGKDRFLDTAFNKPEALFYIMEQEGLVESYLEAEEFCENFDVIWKYEKQVYEGRKISDLPEAKLLHNIFRFRDPRQIEIDKAKEKIISTLLGKVSQQSITTQEEFQELYNLIQNYSKQLDLEDGYKVYKVLFDKSEELEQEGKTREEILELLPQQVKDQAEQNFRLRDFLKLDNQTMLKQISNPQSRVYEDIISGVFEDDYSIIIAKEIFKGIDDNDIANRLMVELLDGLGTYILEKGWNLDTLGVEVIELIGAPGITFNMYEANGEDIKYLSTLTSSSEDGMLEELQVCQAREKLSVLENNPELLSNGILFIGKSGSILEYNGNNNYIFINENKDSFENYGDTTYHSSYAENLKVRMGQSAKRYYTFHKHDISEILKKEAETMKRLQEKYETVTGKRKLSPLDVERATKDITIKDVEKMLDEITSPKKTKEEALEKGIGYE
ncbi:MAG: hypothetical protein IKL55_06680 [Clostridia bacterium]|nr:hypothetical protein [Clostridia bacterium]